MFRQIKQKYNNVLSIEDLSNNFQEKYISLIESLKDENPIIGVDTLIKKLHHISSEFFNGER